MGQKSIFASHKKFVIFVVVEIVILWTLYQIDLVSIFWGYDTAVAEAPNQTEIRRVNGMVHLPMLGPKHMFYYYTEVRKGVWCFKEGTNLSLSKDECQCHSTWIGVDCGIPLSIWNSLGHAHAPRAVNRRARPRRLIYSLILKNNPVLFELRQKEYGSIVDIYLVGIEKFSVAWRSRKLYSGKKNILPYTLFLGNVTNTASGNPQFYKFQDELWKVAWHNLTDIRPDDLVIFTDEHSIPSREMLQFFKLYSGFSEPLSTEFTHVVYNFMWTMNDTFLATPTTNAPRVQMVTFNFLQQVCEFVPSKIYDGSYQSRPMLKWYQSENGAVKNWVLLSLDPPVSWYCHWCLRPREIYAQLRHSPYKVHNVTQVENLINNGVWLNGMDRALPSDVDNITVPSSLFKYNAFSYLLGSYD